MNHKFSFYNEEFFCFRVIVGAPAAETNQKDIIRGGSVFKCDISRDNNCHVIRFDTRNGKESSLQYNKHIFTFFTFFFKLKVQILLEKVYIIKN